MLSLLDLWRDPVEINSDLCGMLDFNGEDVFELAVGRFEDPMKVRVVINPGLSDWFISCSPLLMLSVYTCCLVLFLR